MPDYTALSDRELNALVAERVMKDAMPSMPENLRDAEDLMLADAPMQSEGKCWWFAVPYEGDAKWVPMDFSGDIAAAWRVVRQMQSRADETARIVEGIDHGGVVAYVRFGAGEYVGAHGPNAMSRAICLAALAAVERNAVAQTSAERNVSA